MPRPLDELVGNLKNKAFCTRGLCFWRVVQFLGGLILGAIAPRSNYRAPTFFKKAAGFRFGGCGLRSSGRVYVTVKESALPDAHVAASY